MDERPTFGSLFAGIGGIDLGLERAGWECRFQVEWDAYCQRVLAKHWPDVPRYGDITAVDWSGIERVDLLAGGFPCQPFSLAGERRGMDDDRWLWPEFARAIRELRPGLVLVENVPGLLVGGGMDAVLGELAELGYDAEWESIPAAAVGAPHLRYRVWIVAHAQRLGPGRLADLAAGDDRHRDDARWPEAASGPARSGTAIPLADSDSRRRGQRDAGERRLPIADPSRDVPDAALDRRGQGRAGRSDPSGSRQLERPLPNVADAERERGQLPTERRHPGLEWARGSDATRGIGLRPDEWWATEPDVGRVAHGVPARVDRLRALGNAVVPQVVEVIGRQLLASLSLAA